MPKLSIARANTVYHRLRKWYTAGKVSVTSKSWHCYCFFLRLRCL